MTGTNHAESRNEDGERQVKFCFGCTEHKLGTSQRTDRPFGLASAWSTQESRSFHKDCTCFFDIRLDMIVFFLRVPGELRPGA